MEFQGLSQTSNSTFISAGCEMEEEVVFGPLVFGLVFIDV